MEESERAETSHTRELKTLRSRVADLEAADAKHRHSQDALQIKTEQLTAVTRAMTVFLETGNWGEASAGLLSSALAQTDSEYGFIGVVVKGASLRVLAHLGIEWSAYLGREPYEEALQDYEERGYLEFTGFDNLFGRVITGRRPIIANDPATDRRSRGLHPGHPPLTHFLGVPIFKAAEVVGMIGIANRPGGYSGSEQEQIEILCRATSVLYNSYRQQQREFELVKQRQEAEEALRHNEVRLQHALDAIEGGVWDWNVQSGQVYFSPRWSSMLGYEPGELDPVVLTWEERLHPEEKQRVMQRVNEHFEGRTSTYRSEHRMRTRSGDWIWVLDRGQVVSWDDDGKPVRMTGTDVDITKQRQAETERRELQAQMQHAQKLESLGVLAGGVAHDFNNLLTAILGHASLALGKLTPESTAYYGLQQIETASLQAAELTTQMLAYSGRGKFVIEPLDLSNLVTEIGRLLETVVHKHIVLKYELAEDAVVIEGDSSQVRQVVMNLITNASEAIGEQSGLITVRTGSKEVDAGYLAKTYMDDGLPGGLYAWIDVSDTGCGIHAETGRKLFDPFFTTKFAGRGLGLAAVLGIVRGHKGAINIVSESDSGTAFTVLFPTAPELEVEPNKVQERLEPVTSGTVLVVDDEPGVRSVTQKILEDSGFDAICAKDGLEAVDLFIKHQDEICLVLLDLTMPGMDGETAFRRINHLRPEMPVILSSGYNEQELSQRFSAHGFCAFIQKPYQAQRLIATLDSVLRLRQ